jgi:uncharacterized protein (DUF1330 family)
MRGIAITVIAAGIGLTFGAFAFAPARAQNAAPAYLLAEVKVTDAAGYGDYANRFVPLLERYGGRIIVRGGQSQVLEGAPIDGVLVFISSPSMEKARQFRDSPEYRALIPLRQRSSTARIYIVEGRPQ